MDYASIALRSKDSDNMYKEREHWRRTRFLVRINIKVVLQSVKFEISLKHATQ